MGRVAGPGTTSGRRTPAPAPGKLPIVLASIRLDFNPQATLFGASLRLETLAIAAVVFVALLFAGIWAGRTGAGLFERHPEGKQPPKLRRDDLILIAFGVVPGAVVGGRLDTVLVHLDYYQSNTNAILDVNVGGLGLGLAVVLGALTGAAVARLMNAPIGRWFAVLAMPTMFVLGAGKLATVLGGAGQGAYSDASWATSYAGSGPWESLNPTYPSVPSQAIEGGLVLAAMLVIWVVPPLLRLRLRRWRLFVRPGYAARYPWSWLTGGRRFLTAMGLWAAMRFIAAFGWRDAKVAGQLNAEQLVMIGVMALAVFGPAAASASVWTGKALGRGIRRAAMRMAAGGSGRGPKLAKADEAKLQAAGIVAVPDLGPAETKLPVKEDPGPRRPGV